MTWGCDRRASAVASAQEYNFDEEFAAFGEQTGIIPTFPYRDCATKVGAYRLAPEVKALGGGKFCFTINVQSPSSSCTNACCNADLYKIEVSHR